MSERPHIYEWHPLDSIRSLRDLGKQALTALMEAIDPAEVSYGEDGDE
jgi:hypothetical protein